MLRCLALILLLPVFVGCERLQNRIDPEVLDCGEGVRRTSGYWIKVLDPQGEELAATEALDARVLRLDASGALPPPLPLSSKHCVNVQQPTALILRSLAEDRSWSALVKDPNELPEQRVRLEDSSRQQVHLRCPEPWIMDGRFSLPLSASPGTELDAFALAPVLVDAAGHEQGPGFTLSAAGMPLAWPAAWPDGPGRLKLRQRNLLRSADGTVAAAEESCAFTIDRQPPTLQLTPAPEATGTLSVQPGSLLRLQIADAHPAVLHYCLAPARTEACTDPSAFQIASGEVSLSMPAQGLWQLQAWATDAAGNRSADLQQAIEVVQRDLIQSISARVSQALAEQKENSWEAGLSLLQALVDYQRLVLPREQEQVQNKLVDSILSVAPSLQEFQRAKLLDEPRRVFSVSAASDSPWLVQTASTLSLWSAQGEVLSQIPIPDALFAVYSPAQKALALASEQELLVIRVGDKALRAAGRLRLEAQSIYGIPAGAAWIGSTSELVLSIQGDLPLLVRVEGDALQPLQRLELKDARSVAAAPDGQLLAAVSSDDLLQLWQRQADHWEALGPSSEVPVKDMQFSSGPGPASLLVLLRDGALRAWRADVLWKEIEKARPDERPSEQPEGLPLPALQTWAGGREAIMERGGHFYAWGGLEGQKTLQPLPFTGFAWDKMRLWKADPCRKAIWLLDDRRLSYWQWQEGSEASLQKRGEWLMAPDEVIDFASHCGTGAADFVSLDRRLNRLRFWSQGGPLPLVQGDSNQVALSVFSAGLGNEESLITAGFDGRIRFWTGDGQKRQEWAGHSAQINEVRYIPEWQQFISSAEDKSSRLWSPDGRTLATLSMASVTQGQLRDGALPIDADHIVSAGTAALGLWSRRANEWVLTQTFPLRSGERSGARSLVRLPGAPRVLARVNKGAKGRAFIINAEGQLTTQEPGLPPLENLRWLEWSTDGSRLALADASQRPQIYHWSAGGWEAEIASSLPALERLSFAADGTRFVAVSAEQLLVGRLADGRWEVAHSTPLPVRAAIESGLQWTSDGSSIIYAQSGQIFSWNAELQLQHLVQAFPDASRVASFGLSQDPRRLAVGAGPWVRILDFDRERLQSRLCSFYQPYLRATVELTALIELCKKETRSTN